MAKVSIVHVPKKAWDQEIFEGVKHSIQLIGGPNEYASKGDKVLIKPNIVTGNPEATTDKRVVYSIAKIFKNQGCHVTIGENPLVNTNSNQIFQAYQMKEIAKKAGAKFINFRKDQQQTIEIPNAKGCNTLKIAKTVLDADLVISTPAMKTHTLCMVTLSLKNMWGTIPPTQRHQGHHKSLNWTLAELNKHIGTKLAIIDGTTAVGTQGPIPLGLLITGNDPVATDAITAIRMGYNPMRIEHIRYSHELGVGEINPKKIQLFGATLEEIKKEGRTSGRKQFRLKGVYTKPSRLTKKAKNIEIVYGEPCSSCHWKLNTALKNLSTKRLSKAQNIAILIGPKAKPIKGKTNVIIGGCLRRYADKGIFIDFCPVYNQDIEQGLEKALGERDTIKPLWEKILESYTEKEDQKLPGF